MFEKLLRKKKEEFQDEDQDEDFIEWKIKHFSIGIYNGYNKR